MGIIIKKISVKDLGPIKEFNKEPGLLNLIYSKNEKGKSFLTEFIIASLFKDAKNWGLRDETNNARGNVIIGGLSEKDIEFSPKSKKKLEDFIEKERGLPQSLKRLLVVKSGKVEIDKNGLNETLLREILSDKKLLEEIDHKIGPVSIKEAEITENTINMNKKGIGKTYYDTKKELKNMQKLWNDVISVYKAGELKGLENKKHRLEAEKEKIDRAKRHLAYRLSKQNDKLEKSLEPLEGILPEIKGTIKIYKKENQELIDEENEYRKLKEKGEDCQWFGKAKEAYNNIKDKITVMPKKTILLSCLLSEFLAIITAIYNRKLPTIGFIIFGLILAGIYLWRVYKSTAYIGDKRELDLLKQEFERKTGKKLVSGIDIEVELNECKKIPGILDEREKNRKNKKEDLKEKGIEIIDKLQELTGEIYREKEWGKIIKTKEEQRDAINREIEKNKNALGRLGVSSDEFLGIDPGVEYSAEEEKRVNDEYENAREELSNKEEAIKNLKIRVQQKIMDDRAVENWNELIEKLREKKKKIEKELEEIEAKIIGKNIVHCVIREFQEDEDEKIREGLKSDKIVRLLSGLTDGHYNSIEWEEDGLKIGNDYESYYFDDLSTGTIEQVMLALRIGFASKLLDNSSMFLVLDDAFQHTDWERRENLIKNQIPMLIKDGWQIIYLTMDNHIKGLFDEVGNKLFSNEYESIVLPAT